MNIQDSLAKNTRYYRKRLHISQEELAARSGLARAQVGLIENGKNITIDTLDRLAAGLNITPSRLLITFDKNGKPQFGYPTSKTFIEDGTDELCERKDTRDQPEQSRPGRNHSEQSRPEHDQLEQSRSEHTHSTQNNAANKAGEKTTTPDSATNLKKTSSNATDTKKAPDSATDLKNCALVYWGDGALEFQELSVDSAEPSIKILSILAQTTSSDHELFKRYKAVWPQIMRLLKIKPDCEWK